MKTIAGRNVNVAARWRDERVSSSFQENPHEGNDCVEQEEERINDEQSLGDNIEKVF